MSGYVWLGIDPGLEGAVAAIEGGEIEIRDTPTYQDGKRRRIDASKCATILREIKTYCESKWEPLPYPRDGATMTHPAKSLMVSIEKSQPMPKNGSIGCFGLGYSYGTWIGILASLEIPYRLVTPQAWKKMLMPGEPKEKDASRIVADRLFPGQRDNWWPLKKH